MPSTPLRVEDAPCSPEVASKVESALAAGELVILPTETVYGIAARADQPAALEALSRVKGRPDDTAFTWHVGDTNCLEALGAKDSSTKRLVDRYWPGPLTLVIPDTTGHMPHLSKSGRVGVRFPAHEATASILRSLPFPVVMSSANLHGEEPAKDLSLLASSVNDAVSLCVDGGPPNLGESSTVLKIGRAAKEERASFEVLREGLHDLATLRRAAGLRLLFVCTGNTCRSPLAEGIAKRAIAKRLGCPDEEITDYGFDVSSAGVFANAGGPASRYSLEQLMNREIDLSAHRARAATHDVLVEADKIYCLSGSHLDSVRSLLPPERVDDALLLDPDGGNTPDPIGGSHDEYRRCADLISGNVEARLDEWA